MTVENHGLISAEQGAFQFGTHPFYEITPLVSDIGKIPAKSTIVVPVTIRRIGEFADDGTIRTLGQPAPARAAGRIAAAAPRPPVPCSLGGNFLWNYLCGNNGVSKTTPIATSGVQGNCPGGPGGPISGGGGPGGGGGPSTRSITFSTPTLCDCKLLLGADGKACLSGSVSFSVPGVLSKFASALTRALPSGAHLDRLDAETAIGGEVCICCKKDGSLGHSESGEITFKVSGEIGWGPPSPPAIIPPAGGNWRIESAGWDIDLGLKVELEGEIKVKVEKDCEGELKACVSGSISAKGFLGAEGEASIRATNLTDRFAYEGKVSGKLGGGVEVSVEGEWCGGSDGHIRACIKGNLVAQLTGELCRIGSDGKKICSGITVGVDRPLFEGCYPSAAGGPPPLLTFTGAAGNAIAPPPAAALFDGVGFASVDFADTFRSTAEILALPEVKAVLPQTSGVCAKVRVKLDQEAVMTRSAFRATLELKNNLTTGSLTGVGFNLDVRDVDGNAAGDVFNVRVTKLQGIAAIDGSGVIEASSTGAVQWTLIPRDSAAPLADTVYTVGGTISYVQGGTRFDIPVEAVKITVRPDAALVLKYFHQRDVFSDDPHTNAIEPSIPYALAVIVENRGAGAARNLTITSGQPEIVDNEKGLLIDFKVIATEVAGQNLSPALSADFGVVNPGERKIATWLMTSSLQGLFTDYHATFEHLDGFGDPRISLIKEVEIHEMIHMVEALGALSDGRPDFLVNDVADVHDYADTIHLSGGATAPVSFHDTATVGGTLGSGNFQVTVQPSLGAGWAYLRIPDPGNGQYRLSRVTRSDGLVIPLDKNVWVTDRTFIGLGQRPTYENILHLLDYNSTGSYTLIYVGQLDTDTQPPSSAVLSLVADSPREFTVRWTGTDNRGVAFYDVYLSVDGAPYQVWLARTLEAGALFRGETGHTYSFFTRATDAAGNLEPAATVADAMTRVTVDNIAPTLAAVPDQQIGESGTLTLDLIGSDPDGRNDLLAYSLASPVPAGITLDSRTGRIRWITGELDGGREIAMTVAVSDVGLPVRSAMRSFVIRVLETNQPPVLQRVSSQRVSAGGVMGLRLDAQDGDLPGQVLQYRFTATAPAGMTMDPNTGFLTWQVAADTTPGTVLVSVAVRDSGAPPLEASTSFAITVDPRPLDHPPAFLANPVQLWLAGSTHTLEVNAFDIDGDSVALELNRSGLPGNLSFATSPGSGHGVVTWNTTGVAPGLYSLPVQATAGPATTPYAALVKIVADNSYWRWAVPRLSQIPDIQEADPTADADDDGTANIFEWAHLRDPLSRDETPMSFGLEGPFEGGWLAVDLDLYRRRGANQFVTLTPQYSTDLKAGLWSDIPASDWEVSLDPAGDRDARVETEEVLFRIWLDPSSPAASAKFFRVKSGTRSVLP